MRVQLASAKIETIFLVVGGSTASFGGGASTVVVDLGILGGGRGSFAFLEEYHFRWMDWRISGVKVSFLTT